MTRPLEMMTSPVMQQIEQAVEGIPGWTPVDQLYTLFNLVCFTKGVEGDVLEIGSWCGRSAVVLGMAARLAGATSVACIDLFPCKSDWSRNEDGSYSFRVVHEGKVYGGYMDQTVWQEPFERDIAPIYEKYDGIYDVFRENIATHGLDDIVTAYKGDSGLLAGMPDFRCRLAFLDGDHGFEAVCKDIANVERCLSPGGWIAFDDAFSCYEGVNRAIEEKIIRSGRYELCQQMTRKLFVARKR